VTRGERWQLSRWARWKTSTFHRAEIAVSAASPPARRERRARNRRAAQ
jgi:hypothetical protein